jgi:Na+-transporting NADH:ubiquinone oxidoreductase subunit NqrF
MDIKLPVNTGKICEKHFFLFLPPCTMACPKYMNCRGLGSCGTCAVWIRGIISQKSRVEKLRLKFPPHQEKPGLRLACQVRVWGDIEVVKGEGFWGQKYSLEKKRINKSQNQPEGNN